MFSFNRDGIKGGTFLNSAFFIILKFFGQSLEFAADLELADGKENLFGVFRICVRSAEGVIEFEKRVGNHFDSSRSRESTEISLDD